MNKERLSRKEAAFQGGCHHFQRHLLIFTFILRDRSLSLTTL